MEKYPFFIEKQKQLGKTILVEKDEIGSNEKDIAEIFNLFFLETNLGGKTIEDNSEISCSVHDITKHYENHPSILKIKEFVKFYTTFLFCTTTHHEMESRIPVKILKECKDII